MEKIRVNQVLSLLVKLNEMSMADFGHEYAGFDLRDGKLFIDASSRSARIALEMLLCGFQNLSVFGDGNCELEIWFY